MAERVTVESQGDPQNFFGRMRQAADAARQSIKGLAQDLGATERAMASMDKMSRSIDLFTKAINRQPGGSAATAGQPGLTGDPDLRRQDANAYRALRAAQRTGYRGGLRGDVAKTVAAISGDAGLRAGYQRHFAGLDAGQKASEGLADDLAAQRALDAGQRARDATTRSEQREATRQAGAQASAGRAQQAADAAQDRITSRQARYADRAQQHAFSARLSAADRAKRAADAASKSQAQTSAAEDARKSSVYFQAFNERERIGPGKNVLVDEIVTNPSFVEASKRHLAGMSEGERAQHDFSQMEALRQSRRQRDVFQRLTSALSWAGTQQMYYYSSALSALGIASPAVLAATGALGVAGAGLAANQLFVGQIRSGEAIQSGIGTRLGSEQEAIGLAQTSTALEYRYGLNSQDTGRIAAGLGLAGVKEGLSGPAYEAAAAAVKLFGLSVEDATKIVGRDMTDLGQTSEQTRSHLESLAQVAIGTGTSAQALAAIVAQTPNLQANLPGGTAATAGMYQKVFGTAADAVTMASLINAGGIVDVARIGAYTGVRNPTQVAAMQATAEGQAQLTDMVIARLQATAHQVGVPTATTQFDILFGTNLAGNQALVKRMLGLSTTEAQTALVDAAVASQGVDAFGTPSPLRQFSRGRPWDTPKGLLEQGRGAAIGLWDVATDLLGPLVGRAPLRRDDDVRQLSHLPLVGGLFGTEATMRGQAEGLWGTLTPEQKSYVSGAVATQLPVQVYGSVDVMIRNANDPSSATRIRTPLAQVDNSYDQHAPNGR